MDDSTRRDLMAVQARLERIERERWAWRAGMGAVLALLFLTGAQATPGVLDEIRTRKVVVVDAQGREWARLDPRKLTLRGWEGVGRVELDPSSLIFYGEQGGPRVELNPSVGLTLFGAQGMPQVFLSLLGLHFQDARGKPRAAFSADPIPMLTLAQGKAEASVEAQPNGSVALSLTDAHGKARAGLSVLSDGSPALTLYDAQKKERAVLGVTELEAVRTGVTERRPESSLVLFDKDGKVLWNAP